MAQLKIYLRKNGMEEEPVVSIKEPVVSIKEPVVPIKEPVVPIASRIVQTGVRKCNIPIIHFVHQNNPFITCVSAELSFQEVRVLLRELQEIEKHEFDEGG